MWFRLDLTLYKEEVLGCMSDVPCSVTGGKQVANKEEKLDDQPSIPKL